MLKNDLYNKTVKRLARCGINDPTSQIIALAEEIERYREKIYGLEERLSVDAVAHSPVKIGDTAFFIINGNVFAGIVYFIRWENHERYGIRSDISASVSPYTTIGASFDDFGKTVFLTREEAEAALAKMDGERKSE